MHKADILIHIATLVTQSSEVYHLSAEDINEAEQALDELEQMLNRAKGYEINNHTVYLVTDRALSNLGLDNQGGGDTPQGGISNDYKADDYSVSIEMRN